VIATEPARQFLALIEQAAFRPAPAPQPVP
jgi:hypothetical protein